MRRQTHGCLYIDAVQHGLKTILLRTMDIDVMGISTSIALTFDCERLWLAFATGNTFRNIDATAMMVINVQPCLLFMPSQAVM